MPLRFGFALMASSASRPSIRGIFKSSKINPGRGDEFLSSNLPLRSKQEEDMVKGYNLGAASYITKPVTFDGLVDLMKTLGKYWVEFVELPTTFND